MLHDLRYSLRGLRRTPAMALTAVCTLALAIGAAAAVFSVIDKVLVQPLPINRADRVVVIWPRERANPTTIGEIPYAVFRNWQDGAQGFQSLAAMGSANWSLILREGEPATIPVAAVSGSFFSLLGTSASIGRTLIPDDDRAGSARVAVISHGSWVRRFGADSTLVGRNLRFQEANYTIVGVMPEGFDYPRGAEFWIPLVPRLVDASKQWNADLLGDPGFAVLFVLGRLDPRVTKDAAQAGVSALIARQTGAGFRPNMEAALTPLDEHIFGSTRHALVALAACVGLVLLIGCANVAVLLLVRATMRAHEMATRLALGASQWRIVRQSTTDALVLTTLGGSGGSVIAYWAIRILVAIAPADAPRLEAVQFDGRSIVFTAVLCFITGTILGIVPAMQTTRWNLGHVLRSSLSRVVRSRRLRRMFVVAQVGLALVLLMCAGLVGRSFRNLLHIDIGFEPRHVVTLDVTVPQATAARYNPFYTELLARIGAMAGVEEVGAVFQRPLEHAGIGVDGTIVLEGQRTEPQFRDWEQNPLVNLESVTPGYFQAIGIAVVRGRAFTDADTERAGRVAIVSETLARRLWPGQEPIGKRLLATDMLPDDRGRPRWATVVGVVRDARYRGLTDARLDLYVPYLQLPDMPVKHLMVRAAGDPLPLIASIRAEARRLEPSALVEKVAAMDTLVERATAPWRFSTWTLGLLSFLALGLACLGVYAAVSQSVVERTREIGVRVAVGALPHEIVRLVFGEGMGLTLTGIVLGSAAAIGVGRLLSSLLYEVRPFDVSTLAGMAILFMIVSAAALIVPARRALRIDPSEALRYE